MLEKSRNQFAQQPILPTRWMHNIINPKLRKCVGSCWIVIHISCNMFMYTCVCISVQNGTKIDVFSLWLLGFIEFLDIWTESRFNADDSSFESCFDLSFTGRLKPVYCIVQKKISLLGDQWWFLYLVEVYQYFHSLLGYSNSKIYTYAIRWKKKNDHQSPITEIYYIRWLLSWINFAQEHSTTL